MSLLVGVGDGSSLPSNTTTPPSTLLLASASYFLALFLIPWCLNLLFTSFLFLFSTQRGPGDDLATFQRPKAILLALVGCGLLYGFNGVSGLFGLGGEGAPDGSLDEEARILGGWTVASGLMQVLAKYGGLVLNTLDLARHQPITPSSSIISLIIAILQMISTIEIFLSHLSSNRPSPGHPPPQLPEPNRRSRTMTPKTSEFSLRSHLSSILSAAPTATTTTPFAVTLNPSGEQVDPQCRMAALVSKWMVLAQTLGVVAASFEVAETSVTYGSTLFYSLGVVRTLFEMAWVIGVGQVMQVTTFPSVPADDGERDPSGSAAHPPHPRSRSRSRHILITSPSRIPTLTTTATVTASSSAVKTKKNNSGSTTPFSTSSRRQANDNSRNTVPPPSTSLTIPMISRAATVSEEFLATTSKDPFCPPPLGSMPMLSANQAAARSYGTQGGSSSSLSRLPSPPSKARSKVKRRTGKGSTEPLLEDAADDDGGDDDAERSKRTSPGRSSVKSKAKSKSKVAKVKERFSVTSSRRSLSGIVKRASVRGSVGSRTPLAHSTSASAAVTPRRDRAAVVGDGDGDDDDASPVIPASRPRPLRASHIPVHRRSGEGGAVGNADILAIVSPRIQADTPAITPSRSIVPHSLRDNRSSISDRPHEGQVDTEKQFLGVLISNALHGGSGGTMLSRNVSTTATPSRPSTSATTRSQASGNTFGFVPAPALLVNHLDVAFHLHPSTASLEDPSGSDTPTAPTPRASRALSPHPDSADLARVEDLGGSGEVGSAGTDLEELLNIRLAPDVMPAGRVARDRSPYVTGPDQQQRTDVAAPALAPVPTALLPAHMFTTAAIISESPASFTTSDEGQLEVTINPGPIISKHVVHNVGLRSSINSESNESLGANDNDIRTAVAANSFHPSTPPRPPLRFNTTDNTLTADLMVAPFPPTPEQIRAARQTFQHPSSFHTTPLPSDVSQSQPIPIPSVASRGNREPAHVLAVGGFPVEDKRMMRLKLSRTYSEESSMRRLSQSDWGGDDHQAAAAGGVGGGRGPPHVEHSGSAPIRHLASDFFKTRDRAPPANGAGNGAVALCPKFSNSPSMVGQGRLSLNAKKKNIT
ncbi:hypothetical protein FRB96_003028 [Tulasnella sp. 330]|nr:hypothetical protein FRB96_003028 [Tulasnella sp. 330]